MRDFLARITVFAAFITIIAASSLAWGHSAASGPYRIQVKSAWGGQLPTYYHRGRAYVLGKLGQRYSITVHNNSNRRVEAVVSVDGLDAIDGKRGDFRKRGYIVQPHGSVTIDGFRVSMRNVAAFRFSRVRDSYAARKGKPRNVGAIGVAIFPERRRYRPQPRPWRPYWSRRYRTKGPRYDMDRPTDRREARRTAPKAPAAERESYGGALGNADSSRSSGRGRYSFQPKRKSLRGLGTEFGERRYSPVSESRFVRASKHWPTAQLVVRYNDRRGLRALGINLNPHRHNWRNDVRRRETARPFRQSPRQFAQPPTRW